jgi:hypothetical protein
MKDSSCHDPKLATYYQEVCRLEDKFDGLELNHIPRRDNKTADTLAKMVSGREPVLSSVFASDQLKPSVHYMEWRRSALTLRPRHEGRPFTLEG